MNMQLIASTGMAQRQSLPLDAKVIMTLHRIRQWYDYFDGEVYISFSGGKDSTVLADLVWSLYPDVPALFSNTGLEYPEIVQFVKRKQAEGRPIVITRPKRTFRDVVQTEGFALVSKKVSRQVRQIRGNSPNAAATIKLYLTGIRRDGVYSKGSQLSRKWLSLVDAPFEISEKCCDVLKKEPFRRYEKETGRKPFIGVMGDEGGNRSRLTECNAFEGKAPQSRPMLFWTEADVWEYIETHSLEYSDIYKDREIDGVTIPGERRTGCMFCAFGADQERGVNRFQRMAKSHPKQWNYCINKLGMGTALDYIDVPYMPEPEEPQMEMFQEVGR